MTLTETMVDALRATFRGPLVGPGDPDYDVARSVWNGMIDKRPAVVARCTGPADVVAAVNFAREHELVTAVRGGGHSAAGKGTCDDGIVIDLSLMKGVRVDPGHGDGPGAGRSHAGATSTTRRRPRARRHRRRHLDHRHRRPHPRRRVRLARRDASACPATTCCRSTS